MDETDGGAAYEEGQESWDDEGPCRGEGLVICNNNYLCVPSIFVSYIGLLIIRDEEWDPTTA